MKNINLLLKTILALVVFTFVSCEDEEYKLGEIKAPSNVAVSYTHLTLPTKRIV